MPIAGFLNADDSYTQASSRPRAAAKAGRRAGTLNYGFLLAAMVTVLALAAVLLKATGLALTGISWGLPAGLLALGVLELAVIGYRLWRLFAEAVYLVVRFVVDTP